MIKLLIPKKVIIFGGGKLISNVFNILKKKNIDLFVFTEKRHLKELIGKNSLKNFLDKENISYSISQNDNDILDKLKPTTLGISYRYSKIFNNKIVDRFKGRLFNIHSQPLPRFRGRGGVSWNIMMNSKIIGSSLHMVSKKIDRGNIILQKKSLISNNDIELNKIYSKLENIDEKIINSFFKTIFEKKSFKKIIHLNNFSDYWPSLKTSKNAWVDFNWESNEVSNFINAFSGKYGGALSYCNKKIIKLLNSKYVLKKNIFHPFQYGLVFKIDNNYIFVACKNGYIKCNYSLGSKNKKIKIGSRIFTPTKKLELSKIHL